MKRLYLYNYLKTYKTLGRFYKNEDYRVHYASYILLGELTVLTIFPLLKLLEYIGFGKEFSDYTKIIAFLIYALFFIVSYFSIEKKLKTIIKIFDKKSKREIRILNFYTRVIIGFIILINIIVMRYF